MGLPKSRRVGLTRLFPDFERHSLLRGSPRRQHSSRDLPQSAAPLHRPPHRPPHYRRAANVEEEEEGEGGTGRGQAGGCCCCCCCWAGAAEGTAAAAAGTAADTSVVGLMKRSSSELPETWPRCCTPWRPPSVRGLPRPAARSAQLAPWRGCGGPIHRDGES